MKTPVSPAPDQTWKFNIEQNGNSIKKKMDGDPEMHILLDITYMTRKDSVDLQDWLLLNLSEDQLDKIEFIRIPKPFDN